MERKHKITIPEPCHENWDEMIPNEKGRFCLSCSKTVIDFRAMLPEEVQHFFIENQNKSICGRFKKSQLDSITIQIPSRVLYTQTHYHKMFLLALFIAMGTTLFSCQNEDGNKQQFEKIEVVEEYSPKPLVKSNREDSIFEKKPRPSISLEDVLTINVEPSGPTGYIGNDYNETQGGIPPPTCYLYQLPEYPGGIAKFTEFITDEFQIPKKAKRITGEIEVSFVIDKTGTLNQIKVFDNIGYETGEEIIRVLQKSKKWKPGLDKGKAISEVFRFNIIVQKDSLNPERRKRNLSKIVSINPVNKSDDAISQVN
ncbi:energy transducer TonB [Flavobacterium sp. ANB]|uniref:energy transducer TonB n=1 Tax=unclassified Flavobacterium TaxID=196869 RepID=UPI0012B8E0BE|nr:MULTISPECIES: energy transducer TonB [unclassified Flavobacterium]MBF4514825.1 energy transducer TonB [Flavobacterium sp. ANB]MTD68151.1 hypothetical protein [Flavobacterium sp. LC2016-13]